MPNSRASETEAEQARGSEERDLAAELEQMEDRLKRALADLDNYRKRAARDLDRLLIERGDRVVVDWLEVVDAVDRALAQNPEGPLREGLEAVLEQMQAILARQGVDRLGEVGEPFDPERHQAVDVRETEGAPDRTIVDVPRSGYARDGRVLRPAQVVVARAPQPQS
jgi:molecular chaperone GrpE